MNIAHVLTSFGVGGQERVALALAAGQRLQGHKVMVVSLAAPPDGPLVADFQRAGVETHSVPKRGPTVDFSLTWRLASLFRREKVDVVHTHNPQPLIYAGMAGRMVGARVIQTRHGVAFHSRRQMWLTRQAARIVDAYVAVSRELATGLRRARACGVAKLWVIENGIDLGRFYPDECDRLSARQELGIPGGALVIGTVSRLISSKNVAGLIQAAEPLLREETRLLIVGEGPQQAALMARVSASPKAAFIHFTGHRNDVPRLLRALDVFALFSRTEGHPISVLEAMASGVCVVATDVGGVPSIITSEETGLLVPLDDEAALSNALCRLVASPSLRLDLGRRARTKAVERYAAARMIDEYGALYERFSTDARCSA